jgi:hypothetical protein
MDIITYAKSKTYTNETAEEFGGLKGANCTIKSIAPISGGNRVTFEWKNTEGATQEGTLDVMDGVDGNDGLGIKSVTINASNHLIITYDDDTTEDAGEVQTVQGEDGKSAYEIAVEHGYSGTEEEWLASLKGEDGEEGFSPTITVKESTSEKYVLTITNKDGSYDTPNLKSGGSGSATNLSDLEDVQLTSLTTGQILKWNGSKWVNEDGVEIDSLGDINDVALGTLTDGQVLSWNATLGKWENKDAVNPTQFATMPTAADYPEAIVQYIGADTATYKRGMFYRSNPSVVSGSVVYTWEQTDVQPSNSDYEQLTNHPEIENVELVGNKTLDDLGINGKFQYSTLPTATVSNAGKIVQYIGTTTADYKKGFWYQSAYDSETSEYVWKNIDVSSNTQLATRIAQLETNQGDMSQLEVAGVSDIVAALNALNGKGLSTITYNEPNLILTYADGTTKTFNVRDSILNETQIGELANVTDTTVANGNVLQYDSAILGYKPYDILTALTNLLTESKDYTDQEIASSLTASAYVCDAKPQYDSVNDLVIYFQNGQAHTTDKTDSRFYYTTSDGSFCSSWIEGTEFTFNVAQVDYDDYVNKNTDVVSTYTEDMADKSKIPDVSALDALLAIVKTALALKVNTSSIIDALTSQDATKVLSANQGYVIKGLIDDKNDKIQFATMPTPASALSGIVYQYVGSSSQAFVKGHFYTCLYDNVNDNWYWDEIKYAADTDSALDPTSKNPVANDALCEEFDKKQDKDLETPIEVDGTEQTTVEDALSALNTYAAKKVDQLNSLPVASADTLGMLVQYKGATTSTLKHAFFYECKVVEGSDPTEYEWVDAGIGGEDLSQYKKIFSGTSAEWDALPLEDKITYDYIMPDDDGETGDITDVVESGNHNAVESDAVYNSEQEIYEVMGKMGAKNLLPNIATSESYASSGTVTKNVNGSLTINGTFDAVTTINIDYLNGLSNAVFDVTDLIGTDIVVTFLDTAVSGITLEVGYFNSAGTRISLEGGVSTKANITFPAGAVKSATYLRIASGTYDNVTVYPMMQLASDTDNTYEPYAKTNQELTAENEALTNQTDDIVNVLGAKNLLPFPYYNTSKTQDGITWTVNSDGSISASGTATANSFFRITQDSDLSIYNNTILSGCPANGEMWSKWALYLSGNKDGQSVTKIDVGSGVLIEDIPAGYSGGLYAKVINGQTVNFTFKPMIRLASIVDNTYEPYSMTNKEMTPYVQAISNPNLLDNPWFTVNQRGQNSYTAAGYTVDRWKTVNSAGTITIDVNDGIQITESADVNDTALIQQILFDRLPFGKSVTISLYDGTKVYSATGVVPSARTSSWQSVVNVATNNGISIEFLIAPSSVTSFNSQVVIRTPKDATARTIKAVKLELGSVSTLAMDTAPNYAQELLKCQYFFVNVFLHKQNYAGPYYAEGNASQLYFAVNLPMPMRAAPSIELDSENIYVIGNNAHATITTYTPRVITMDNNVLKASLANLDATEITDVDDHLYALNFFDSNTKKFWLSADL